MSDALTLTPTISETDDRDARVLEAIHAETAAGNRPAQRDIAHAVGLSLGMTNSILRRLAQKGFVTMQRINARNVHYLVTPDGVDMIARRSYRYLRRTVGHIVRYKERMRAWCREQRAAGVQEIILVGESDLAFLVEWCAEKEGLAFAHYTAMPRATADTAQVLASEYVDEAPAAVGRLVGVLAGYGDSGSLL